MRKTSIWWQALRSSPELSGWMHFHETTSVKIWKETQHTAHMCSCCVYGTLGHSPRFHRFQVILDVHFTINFNIKMGVYFRWSLLSMVCLILPLWSFMHYRKLRIITGSVGFSVQGSKGVRTQSPCWQQPSNIGISDWVQWTVLGVLTQQMGLKPDLALNRI